MNAHNNEIIHNVWPLYVGEYHNSEHPLIKKELLNYFENYEKAKKAGVKFLAYRCKLSSKEIKIEKKINIIDE